MKHISLWLDGDIKDATKISIAKLESFQVHLEYADDFFFLLMIIIINSSWKYFVPQICNIIKRSSRSVGKINETGKRRNLFSIMVTFEMDFIR